MLGVAVAACCLEPRSFRFAAWFGPPKRGVATAPPPLVWTPSPVVAGFLRRIRECNNGVEAAAFGRPFRVGGSDVGLVLPKAAAELERFPEVFRVAEDSVDLIAGGDSLEARSDAVAGVLQQLRDSGRIPMLKGWRSEGWPVKESFHAPVQLVIERAAGPLFGVGGFGCHINGFVSAGPDAKVPLSLWVARRAKTKPTYPGKLDHMVAGGLSHGERPGDNVIRECAEEASIPPEIAKKAKPAGFVSYSQRDETNWGVKRDVIFCYDLDMPRDFSPTANDGEVDGFELWDMQRVIDSITADNDEWKPNVAVVIIDMLIRRGLLTPEDAGYVELVHALRS